MHSNYNRTSYNHASKKTDRGGETTKSETSAKIADNVLVDGKTFRSRREKIAKDIASIDTINQQAKPLNSRELQKRLEELAISDKNHLDAAPEIAHTSSSAQLTPKDVIQNFIYEAYQSGAKDAISIYERYALNDNYQTHHMLSEKNHQAYLSNLSTLSEQYEDTTRSYPQTTLGNKELSTHEFIAENLNRQKEPEFYRVTTKDKSKRQQNVQARLSIRLNPKYATRVFAYVTSELVSYHPNVKAAKLAGPIAINRRTDSLVIYLTSKNEESAQNIANDLYSRFRAKYFGTGAPIAMKELKQGIGYAQRHPKFGSHGKSIAAMAETALTRFDAHLDTVLEEGKYPSEQELWQHFMTEILPQALKDHQIDPDEPYKIIDIPTENI